MLLYVLLFFLAKFLALLLKCVPWKHLPFIIYLWIDKHHWITFILKVYKF